MMMSSKGGTKYSVECSFKPNRYPSFFGQKREQRVKTKNKTITNILYLLEKNLLGNKNVHRRQYTITRSP